VAALVRGDPPEARRAARPSRSGEGVVEEDRVALEAQVREALGRLGGIGCIYRAERCRALTADARPGEPSTGGTDCATSRGDVTAAMPPLDERLRLAERTMVALVADAELPPKIGVHPAAEGSFGHAMPAHLRAPIRTAATTSSG
jgi:hypothetical protein